MAPTTVLSAIGRPGNEGNGGEFQLKSVQKR